MTIPATAQTWFAKLWRNRTFNHSLQINILRAASLGIGFIGSIWSSRCLGPVNLGISGMIIGTITPLVLLINLNQSAHYIRLYRGHTSEFEQTELVTIISTFKITACMAMMIAAVPLLLLGNFSSAWHLGLIAAFPFFFFNANTADWLLQSQDNLPAVTRAMTVQALITTSLYLLIFRPGMSAGSDLVVQDVGLLAAFAFAWFTALKRRRIPLLQWQKLGLIVPIIKEGRWLIATGITVYIYTSLEVPLLGWLYSLKEVGIYRTSIVLVSGFAAFTGYLPMLLYPRMMEWNQEGPHVLWQNQKKIFTFFLIFAGTLCLGAFLLAPFGYHYIYGRAFQRGAYPFAFLLTAKMIAVMNGILGWGLVAQRKDRNLFNNMAYVSAFSLGSNLIFIPFFGAYAASIINLLSELLLVTLNITFIQRSLRNLQTTA